MVAGGGDFQRALCGLLPDHFAEIGAIEGHHVCLGHDIGDLETSPPELSRELA